MYEDVVSIKKIEIIPIPPKNGLTAFASFIIDDCFFVGNVGIYSSPSSPDGFRLVYPTKAGVSCFNPVRRDVGEEIQKQVISKYSEIIEKLRIGEKDLNEKNYR